MTDPLALEPSLGPADRDARYGGDVQGCPRHGGVPLLRELERSSVKQLLLVLCICVLPGAAGCRSPDDEARQARTSAASWCRTLRETALGLRAQTVPSRFAKDTFRQGREELVDGLSRIQKLAPRSKLAADSRAAVAEALNLAAALPSDAPAELDARAGRLGALAAELSRGASP